MGRRYDDGDGSDDAPARRVRRGSGLGVALGAVLGGGALFAVSLGGSESAVQQAAAGAVFGGAFVGLYVAARCVEKVAAAIDRIRSAGQP
jgi:hypothetical protein